METTNIKKTPHPVWGRLVIYTQVIAAAGLVCWLAGKLGELHWLLDMCSHFLQQSLLVTGLAVVVTLVARRWKLFLVWLLVSAPMAYELGQSYLPVPAISSVSGQSVTEPRHLRLALLNVYTANTRHQEVIDDLIKTDPDVMVLQEVDRVWDQALHEALSEYWPHSVRQPRSDNFGIVLYSRVPFLGAEAINLEATLPVPSLDANLDLGRGKPLRILATHPLPPISPGYWQARNNAYAGVVAQVGEQDKADTVVVGDLNSSPWSPCFKRLLRESSLRNSADGFGVQNSWSTFATTWVGLPLDYVLVSKRISVAGHQIGPPVGSDHRAVVVDLTVP